MKMARKKNVASRNDFPSSTAAAIISALFFLFRTHPVRFFFSLAAVESRARRILFKRIAQIGS